MDSHNFEKYFYICCIQHKVNGGWGVLEQLIVIECVLQGSSFIHLVKHRDSILTISIQGISNIYAIKGRCIQHTKLYLPHKKLISRSFYISAVHRMKINEPKTLLWGTPETKGLNWLKPTPPRAQGLLTEVWQRRKRQK